jgi:hypothetical protein
MEAYSEVRRCGGQSQNTELTTKREGVGDRFPLHVPLGGSCRTFIAGALGSPGWGWQVPYLRSPGGPAAPRGTAGRGVRPWLQRSTPGKARSSGCTGLLGLPGQRRGAPRLGCSRRTPTIASGARAPPLRPARPTGGKQQPLAPSRLSGNFLHLDREEGLVRRSQSRGAWEVAAVSAGPPLRDALPGLALSAGCRAPGYVPALRLYRACHLGSPVQGRATAPPSLRAQGKMIPRPSGQKQPRDSGSRMNLGRDHTRRASFVFRCSHSRPSWSPQPPSWQSPGAPHFRAQLSGIPILCPGGHRHSWALGRICP